MLLCARSRSPCAILVEEEVWGVAEFIYTMKNVRKAHGEGAKIGVVGPNGNGQVVDPLKIMAGIDQPSNGEAFLGPRRPPSASAAGAAARRDKTVRRTSKRPSAT